VNYQHYLKNAFYVCGTAKITFGAQNTEKGVELKFYKTMALHVGRMEVKTRPLENVLMITGRSRVAACMACSRLR
jgi:hypothetical protein